MIKIYLANTEALDVNAEYKLSRYRRERIEAVRGLRQRQESIGAELLLNIALKEELEAFVPPANIAVGNRGKPELLENKLYFSLSHSHGYAACAVAESSIGLDIEKEAAVRERVLSRVFTQTEQSYVLSHPRADYAFTRLWVMKESLVKESGRGLGEMLEHIDVLDMKGFWHGLSGNIHLALYCPAQEGPQAEIVKIELPRT